MNNFLSINSIGLPVLGSVLILVAMCFYLIVSLWRLRDPVVDETEALGFAPIDPSIALIDKVAAIVDDDENPDNFELLDVTHRRTGIIDCYLLDIRNTRRANADKGNEGALVIFSPHLHLPRFTLAPKPRLKGAVGALVNPVLDWLANIINRQRVAFSAAPEFEHHYLVTAKDPTPVRDFFTPALLNYLEHTAHLYIRASGNGFICSLIQQPRHTLEEQVQAAMTVYNAFSKLGAANKNHKG